MAVVIPRVSERMEMHVVNSFVCSRVVRSSWLHAGHRWFLLFMAFALVLSDRIPN